MEFFDQLLSSRVERVYPSKEALLRKLNSETKLTIYLGIDPSSPKIHLGNAIALHKLREFQTLGHKIILLIGDFTGMIGDPTDKAATRKPLTREQVLENSKTYREQAEKILNFTGKNPAEIAFNSHWLAKLNLEEVIKLAAHFTVAQLLERDMFQKRLAEHKPIGLHEFLYPLMQGYDSVALNVDLEIGGTDQTFNMLVGRALVRDLINKEKFVLTLPLLEGTDGRKMSKSFGNSIDIDTAPNEMFGQVMSLRDELILKYFVLCTGLDEREIKAVSKKLEIGNPFEVKKKLAWEIVKIYYNSEKADAAEKEFVRVYSKKEPIQIDEVSEVKLDEILGSKTYASLATAAGTVSSNQEAIRIAKQGGFFVNDVKITDARAPIESLVPNTLYTIQAGKRRRSKVKIVK